MINRSSKNKVTGLFTDWDGREFFRGEFADMHAADRAGADAERRMTTAMLAPAPVEMLPEMTDDEILAELAL